MNNFDPTIMRNPTTTGQRIYVGNLLESVTTPDLTTHFSKYGLIRGVLINRGFGFIQFDTDQNANAAIKAENGTMFQGRKIIVRNAVKNPVSQNPIPAPVSIEIDPNGAVIPQDLNRTARQAWNRRGRGGGAVAGNHQMGEGGDRDRSPLSQPADQDPRWGNNQNQNHFMGRGGPNRFPPQQHQQQQQQPSQSNQNDCEIIVVNKNLMQYAEAIEARLHRLGMRVDIMFPNDDVPIGKVLSNIASRGTLYAILVLPMNQEHRSITVNVLHGDPTEHRNMPVEDALQMLANDFQYQDRSQQVQQQQQQQQQPRTSANMPTAVEITPTSLYAAPPLNIRHPDAIQTLIHLLGENRPLTVLQYDRVIRYLQDRRELQLKAEIGDAPRDITIPEPVDPEAELQKKIMSILNKPSITNTTPAVVAPTPVKISTPSAAAASMAVTASASTTATSPKDRKPELLNDPKVQKALDSLLSGSLFNF